MNYSEQKSIINQKIKEGLYPKKYCERLFEYTNIQWIRLNNSSMFLYEIEYFPEKVMFNRNRFIVVRTNGYNGHRSEKTTFKYKKDAIRFMLKKCKYYRSRQNDYWQMLELFDFKEFWNCTDYHKLDGKSLFTLFIADKAEYIERLDKKIHDWVRINLYMDINPEKPLESLINRP